MWSISRNRLVELPRVRSGGQWSAESVTSNRPPLRRGVVVEIVRGDIGTSVDCTVADASEPIVFDDYVVANICRPCSTVPSNIIASNHPMLGPMHIDYARLAPRAVATLGQSIVEKFKASSLNLKCHSHVGLKHRNRQSFGSETDVALSHRYNNQTAWVLLSRYPVGSLTAAMYEG